MGTVGCVLCLFLLGMLLYKLGLHANLFRQDGLVKDECHKSVILFCTHWLTMAVADSNKRGSSDGQDAPPISLEPALVVANSL